MENTELIVIGGFLGAGKTTSLLSMAKHLIKKGKKIGIVTNDQGSDLVDTNFLKSSGLSVLEVTGGCFCCNFDQFTEKIQKLSNDEKPDIILAEPVGSCTDLIATIFKPIKLNYNGIVTIHPLSVVVDPKRIKRFMMEEKSDFHSEINYLFTKQLEEADVIVLNKIDTLTFGEIDGTISYITDRFKGSEVICVSALEDKNIDMWADIIAGNKIYSEKTLEIDYDIYAQAEAWLGWLNLTGTIDSEKEIDINNLINDLMYSIRMKFIDDGYEIAHLKIYAVNESDWAKASITSVYEEVSFDKRAGFTGSKWNIIINTRVDITAEDLQTKLQDSINQKMSEMDISIQNMKVQCFVPGRPNPKYRIQN